MQNDYGHLIYGKNMFSRIIYKISIHIYIHSYCSAVDMRIYDRFLVVVHANKHLHHINFPIDFLL